MHHADLDLGYTAHAWPSDFVDLLLRRRRRELAERAGFLLTLEDRGEDLPLLGQIFALLGVYVAIIVVTGLIAIALKWLVLGRTKPGVYPLWGVYYFRWWFAKRLEPLVHIKWLQGSPMIRR